ncbi:MAG TPA: nucleotidyl transferase AbiEii/AbiGii toxin family protein [Gemmataceae bacterium]|nr:nucleotidyl transferase AbiEii/AbiGii toxin family protein [Gemmataceae bacterium]
MSDVLDQLMRANADGRPVEEVVRHHLLEGVLRRVDQLGEPEGFVLRGGMLTRLWARPLYRPARDLDYVGTFPFDADMTAGRFAQVLTTVVDDGVVFDVQAFRAKPIWQGTPFPGVRLYLRLGLGTPETDLTIDIGFNDPLLPPAERVEYPLMFGDSAAVWCVAPETMAGWKLHGLAEQGARRWRAKDLADLWLMATRARLRDEQLPAAIHVAFTSRGYTIEDAQALFAPAAWWASKAAAVAWRQFRRETPGLDVPELLADVVNAVRQRFEPWLSATG